MQYNWKYRKYYNGHITSNDFDEVVGNRSAIKLDRMMYAEHNGIDTPIHGVKLLPYQDSPELVRFLDTFRPHRERTKTVWSEFKQAIFEQWDTTKIHVIGASSGYDSRLIAKAIKQLYKKHGSGWLGETHFIECGGEGEGFEAIMKALEWENYTIWKPDYDFDYFMDHHKRYNGLCAFPVNQWYDYYVRNFNEDDIQYISGYAANVADAMRITSPFLVLPRHKRQMSKGQLLQRFFKWNYSYQISAFREPKHSFHPFISWRYIQAVSNFENRSPKTSHLLAKHFVPECKHIDRTPIWQVARNGDRTVSPKVMKKLYDWYINTRHGSKYPIRPTGEIAYNKWWLHFNIASYLCDK